MPILIHFLLMVGAQALIHALKALMPYALSIVALGAMLYFLPDALQLFRTLLNVFLAALPDVNLGPYLAQANRIVPLSEFGIMVGALGAMWVAMWTIKLFRVFFGR